MPFFIFLGFFAVVFILMMSIYNKLVRLRNLVKNAFSQIDVQLKRRYDLIPNLVETAKAYLNHEKETLESVIRARNTAMGAVQALESGKFDPTKMQNLLSAESLLSQNLSRLLAVAESYPDLKANQNMA
ncbi:MAG: LemA family protein, partial [Bdellovibrio sp.]